MQLITEVRAANVTVRQRAAATLRAGSSSTPPPGRFHLTAPDAAFLYPRLPGALSLYRRRHRLGALELAKAGALVAHSHTQGMYVTVWSSTPEEARDGRLARQVLDALGHRTSLRPMSLDKQLPYVLDPGHRTQIGTWGSG